MKTQLFNRSLALLAGAAIFAGLSVSGQQISGDPQMATGTEVIKGNQIPAPQLPFGGVIKDPYGQTKAGFTIHGKINRKDYGLTYNALTEAGGLVISDEVRLAAEIQLVKQPA